MADSLDLVFEYVEPLIEKYSDTGASDLSAFEQTVLSVWLLEADVNNGGFNQYYWNSSGDFANVVSSSLLKIGAKDTADIVKEANANFPNETPPQDRNARQQILEELEQSGNLKLDILDSRFYASNCDLTELLFRYLVKEGAVSGT